MDIAENRLTTIEEKIVTFDNQENILKDHSSNLIVLDASMNIAEKRLDNIEAYNLMFLVTCFHIIGLIQ